MRISKTLSTLALLWCVAAPAFADAAEKKKVVAPKDEEAEDEAEPAEAKGADPLAQTTGAAGDGAGEGDGESEAAPQSGVAGTGAEAFARISDEEETIYAVQRKAFLVNRKIELTPMFAATFADRFVQTFAPAASVTYHLAENIGIEAFGAYMFPSEADLTTEILEKGKLTPEVAKLTQMLWAAGLGLQWSPIYGKLQLFGASLGNFSVYIGAGAGIGQTRVQCTAGLELDPNAGFEPSADGKARCPTIDDPEDVMARVYEPSRTQFMGSISGGVRFYFSNSIGLKVELKDWVFATRVYRPTAAEATQKFTDAIRNNIFAQIGLSFLFGGEE